MPTGMVQMWVYVETHKAVKELAKAAGVTIADMVRSRFENSEADEAGYEVEKQRDEKLLAGDFTETGKGKPKSIKPFEFEGKTYEFRKLTCTAKDREVWKHYREDGSWEAYCAWYKQETGREWRGDVEFEDTYLRG